MRREHSWLPVRFAALLEVGTVLRRLERYARRLSTISCISAYGYTRQLRQALSVLGQAAIVDEWASRCNYSWTTARRLPSRDWRELIQLCTSALDGTGCSSPSAGLPGYRLMQRLGGAA